MNTKRKRSKTLSAFNTRHPGNIEPPDYTVSIDNLPRSPIPNSRTKPKSPPSTSLVDTNNMIKAQGISNFSDFVGKYLRKKKKDHHDRWSFVSKAEDITKDNYYIKYLAFIEERLKLPEKSGKSRPAQYNGSILSKILNDFFENHINLNDTEIRQEDARRAVFTTLFKEILPGYVIADPPPRIYFAPSGKALVDMTKTATSRSTSKISNFDHYAVQYYSTFDDRYNQNELVECNDDVKNWIIECINNRNNNFLKDKKKQNVNADTIIKQQEELTIKKQFCGVCWICNHPIYHYTAWKKNKLEYYLNSKCGEDEHVLPPLMGDMVSTLNQNKELYIEAIEEHGTSHIYTYGLRPSHAFCNQAKGDFLLLLLSTGFLGDRGDKEASHNFEDGLKNAWINKIRTKFESKRYYNYENRFYKKDGEMKIEFYEYPIYDKQSYTTTYNFQEYAIDTYEKMKKHIEYNIAPILKDQAIYGKSSIMNMIKLKTLIFIIQFAILTNPDFKRKWDKNVQFDITTVSSTVERPKSKKSKKFKNTKSKGGKTRKKKRITRRK